ncbi:hypothetical protein EI77_04526 [Prosthecobacter fusiformis]|uniref:Pre-peptidase n=1 Tax=Prosthecobacter fusiformis TaxID=48464 RepID=A0A4R7RLS4_9BACT|nr:hypothetical protein [Prosthecobacter fusiformis]TDU63104.1 hypothetical protein EI77_04526 [Prosthecobacter fusiformis]
MKTAPFFLLLSLAPLLHAEPPKLDSLFPAGGQSGTSFTLTTGGKLDDKVSLWTEASGVHFIPTGKKGEWQSTVTARAQSGIHLVYAYNNEGVSEPRPFSIGHFPELAETEPNNEAGKGQVITKLPVCINARLGERGDVDGYSVQLKKGQTLVAIVEAYALGSPVDVMAHILDPEGRRVLTVSDGRNLDPMLAFQAEKDGLFTVQLAGFIHPPAADIKFTGSSNTIYRLHLSTGPVVTQVYPAAIARQGKTEVELLGYNLDPKKAHLTIDASTIRHSGNDTLIDPKNCIQPIQVITTEKPPLLEKEPNNSAPEATPVQSGTVAAGRILDKTDVDRYMLIQKKGEKMQARIKAKQLGLPLDATLKVEGPDGQIIVTSIDQGDQADPTVAWTATAEGAHQLIVEDQFHRGGPNHHYIMEIGLPKPTYSVTLPERKPVILECGKTLGVKMNVKMLNGFKEPLIARASGLPAGVHAPDVEVPVKGGEVVLKLVAASNATPATQPITFQVWTTKEPASQITADYPLMSEDMRGTTLKDRTSWFWLIVR